jgi:hypothetical protein
MNHANATLDLESANVPASALPTSDITPAQAKEEKEAIYGATVGNNDEVVVAAAGGLDGEEEPTDEEYATLRK